MAERQLYEVVLEASAEVIRGCCGKDHEVGPCPYENETEEDPT